MGFTSDHHDAANLGHARYTAMEDAQNVRIGAIVLDWYVGIGCLIKAVQRGCGRAGGACCFTV